MANSDDLREIRKGVESWNRYVRVERRLRGLHWRPNLVEVDLSGASLHRADLRYASLTGVSLRRASLADANLVDADLTGAILDEANLHRANLRRANLIGADFTKANLANTDLKEADLGSAVLAGASLAKARFTKEEQSGRGTASFLDLASCHGLEEAKFDSPDFLPEYLERAFRFALRENTRDAQLWSSFVEDAPRRSDR